MCPKQQQQQISKINNTIYKVILKNEYKVILKNEYKVIIKNE